MNGVLTVFVVTLLLAVSYGAVAGLTWIICQCFELTFTLKAAFGVWLILVIIGWISKE